MKNKCIFILACTMLLTSGLKDSSTNNFLDFTNSLLSGTDIRVDHEGIQMMDGSSEESSGVNIDTLANDVSDIYAESTQLGEELQEKATTAESDGTITEEENEELYSLAEQWVEQNEHDSKEFQDLMSDTTYIKDIFTFGSEEN